MDLETTEKVLSAGEHRRLAAVAKDILTGDTDSLESLQPGPGDGELFRVFRIRRFDR